MRRGIGFRDRSLKPNETSHYYCEECGQDIPPDFVDSHKCNPLAKVKVDEKEWVS